MDLSTASLDPLLTANGLVKSEEEQIFLSATGEEGIKGEGEEEVQVGGEEGREGGGGGGGSGRGGRVVRVGVRSKRRDGTVSGCIGRRAAEITPEESLAH